MESYRIGVFCADITPPLGHALCGGLVLPAAGVRDPLTARGFVLLGPEQPLVYAVLDWCELRNEGYHEARRIIARNAQTSVQRVIISTVHPHDSPIFDLHAEQLLRNMAIEGLLCDPDFFYRAIEGVAEAIAGAMESAVALTHIGTSIAKVEKIASNRRIPGSGREIKAWRGSSVPPGSPLMDEPEGEVDPYLRLVVFKSGEKEVAALATYATHPMSFYRTALVSADFPADARSAVEKERPQTLLIYANGCGGDIAPGKYNNGNEESRKAMAGRLAKAWKTAWQEVQAHPLEKLSQSISEIDFSVHLPEGFTKAAFEKTLNKLPKDAGIDYLRNMQEADPEGYVDIWNAVSGLSWLENLEKHGPVQISSLDFGHVKLLNLPGEAFIHYQLTAQKMLPDKFVVVAAYGDCGMGYIPINRSWGQAGYEEDESFLAPGVEGNMVKAIAEALGTGSESYVATRPTSTAARYVKWPHRKKLLDSVKLTIKRIKSR